MRVTIVKELFEAVGAARMKKFGLSTDHYRWSTRHDVNLKNLELDDVVALIDLCEPHERAVKGTRRVVSDCRVWLKALDGDDVKVRRVQQFEDVAREWCRKLPHKLLYREESGVWLPYLVNGIDYTAPDRYHGEYVTVDLIYQRLGKAKEWTRSFNWGDLQGRTCKEVFAEAGLFPETSEMREDHAAALERYGDLHARVGLQVLGRGSAEELQARAEWWWRSSSREVLLERDGLPSRMVVDVFREDDGADDRGREATLSGIWRGDPDDEDDDVDTEDEDGKQLAIPIHPHVVCFDLRRHMRLVVHVGNLEVYEYDRSLDAKLVLPDTTTRLIRMLLSSSSEFKDIVGSKGGGVVILCAGSPGTGKTLTAEVYAESLGRPLYSVQCSQLGTDPDDLEKNLLIIFARAQRWNAILLLDEADVYVMTRGKDLAQNAIVGVFLRTLEYYRGVLFMTTNRSDLVDDAVASRCVARVDYEAPGRELLARIWEVLALSAGIVLGKKVIAAAVEEWPDIVGRDVKNMLKLGQMMATEAGRPIDYEMLRFVKQFKPTQGAARP